MHFMKHQKRATVVPKYHLHVIVKALLLIAFRHFPFL